MGVIRTATSSDLQHNLGSVIFVIIVNLMEYWNKILGITDADLKVILSINVRNLIKCFTYVENKTF